MALAAAAVARDGQVELGGSAARATAARPFSWPRLVRLEALLLAASAHIESGGISGEDLER